MDDNFDIIPGLGGADRLGAATELAPVWLMT